MNFYDLIFEIEKRPQMYFSEVSTSSLEAFLYGYLAALNCYPDRYSNPVCEFREFNDWVQCRLHSDRSCAGWRFLLLEYYKKEEIAFKKFFNFVREFKIRTFKTTAELIDCPNICKTSNGTTETEKILPSIIKLGKYTDDPGYWIKTNNPNICNLDGFYKELEFFENFISISRTDWIVYDKDMI
jgi:hypothetical protein